MPGKKKKIDLSLIKIPVWAKPNKLIWVEERDPKTDEPINFTEAVVEDVDETKKTIKVSYPTKNKGKPEVLASYITERSEIPQVLEDLVDIDPLNDAELLKCMELRFMNDDIYCYCGPTLIATNPYRYIEKYGNPDDKKMFRNYALNGGKTITFPHIWNLASRCFWQLFDNGHKQAICISGESGAGKSVGTKLCMGFITSLFNDEDAAKGDKKEDEVPIEDKILGCNPVLESFGNARTVRNDNSSRFGKYFIMYVDRDDKHIKGAEIKNYLLEKSRIIIQAETERNYHIFYAILRFMKPEEKEKYGYMKMEDYNYLKKSKCFTCKTVDDEEFYDDTCNSFRDLGFSPIEQDAIWQTLSAVLNLGNVGIDAGKYVEGSDPACLENNNYMKKVLANLKLDYDKLSEGCCVKVRKIGKDIASSPRSPIQCENIRDALAKDLFNNVFNWIVKKLNVSLLPENKDQYTSIGLLDIFGFEDFDVNSIEQYCINYTNEKLQNLYISYVFKAERVIFEEEGLTEFIDLIKYTDNQPIMDLMDKKPFGIFHLVDSTGKVAKDDGKDDDKLLNSIAKNHTGNEYFWVPRLKKDIFGIKHTAKDVEYYIQGFCEKNKDELPGNLVEVIHEGDAEIMKIFDQKMTHDEVLEEKKKNPLEKFLGYKFRVEMQSLMDELLSCECNFVRCIKPNETKQKNFWVPELALTQIRYLGILDSINVRRESLPVRRKFDDFYQRYQDLDEKSDNRLSPFKAIKSSSPDWKVMCDNIIDSLPEKKENQVLTGNSRVFMSVNFQNYLQECLEEKQKVKKDALNKIIIAFKTADFAMEWDKYRNTTVKVIGLAKNLFTTWNCKIEYIKYKKFLSIVSKM